MYIFKSSYRGGTGRRIEIQGWLGKNFETLLVPPCSIFIHEYSISTIFALLHPSLCFPPPTGTNFWTGPVSPSCPSFFFLKKDIFVCDGYKEFHCDIS
jgi:hypothetical protein